jgi:alkylation response protein AidB-like acyl-CoA dehydrogenase
MTDFVAVARELAPAFAERAAGHDRDASFPYENLAELVSSGYTAMTVPPEYGGPGAGLAELCAAQQVLAGACASTAFAVNMHVHGLAMIARLGGDGAERACRAVLDGAVIAGGFSEPGVGGNWWHPTTRADEVDGGFVLNGRKGFFTGYPGATHLFLSAAVTDDRDLPQPVAFLVPKPERGVRVTAEWDAAGMRATGSHSLALEDLFVESRWAVGDRGTLPLLFMLGVHWAWCSFAACFVGIARAALEHVTRTQQQRVISVIGRPNANLPGIQFKVAEMAARVAAAEAFLDAAIHAEHEEVDPLVHYIDMSVMKTNVTRLAYEVVVLGMQVQGGSGLVSSDPLQRMYRDVVAGLLVPPATDVVLEWAGKQALGVPIFAEPRWSGTVEEPEPAAGPIFDHAESQLEAARSAYTTVVDRLAGSTLPGAQFTVAGMRGACETMSALLDRQRQHGDLPAAGLAAVFIGEHTDRVLASAAAALADDPDGAKLIAQVRYDLSAKPPPVPDARCRELAGKAQLGIDGDATPRWV